MSDISPSNNEKNIKILDSRSFNLSLDDTVFELTMNLSETFIEFKLIPKNSNASYCYKENYDLSAMNKNLFGFFKELKKSFEVYSQILKDNKVKLVLDKEKNIMKLNYKTIINYNEEVDTNLELKRFELTKDDLYSILLNQVNEMQKELSQRENIYKESIKQLENKMKEYIDKKMEEIKKQMEDKIEILVDNYMKKKKEEEKIEKQNKEEELRLKEEEKIKKNDNVNLINDFKCEKIINMENIMTISNSFPTINNIAVYTIIRNNKIYYEIAYQEFYIDHYSGNQNYQYYNINIHNILSNTVSNRIKNPHGYFNLKDIKHYYHSLSKKHFLLTSAKYSDNKGNYDQYDKCYYYSDSISIKLWNISSNIITNEVSIKKSSKVKNTDQYLQTCLLFSENDYYIIYCSKEGNERFNKKGESIGSIPEIKISDCSYLEAAYIENNPYLLLAGANYSLSYSFNNTEDRKYISDSQRDNIITIINLFNHKNKKYLISGDNKGNVVIFDFFSKNPKPIKSIFFNKCITALCSLNEQYFLVGNNNKELNVFDFESKSIKKTYEYKNNIQKIEKLKIPDKGEFIINLCSGEIHIWEI